MWQNHINFVMFMNDSGKVSSSNMNNRRIGVSKPPTKTTLSKKLIVKVIQICHVQN
jgi:hypothetical protein